MRRLFLISYYFPPDGGGGTQRPTKFCKYLPGLEWDVTVITRMPENKTSLWTPKDESVLGDEFYNQINIVRVEGKGEPGKWERRVLGLDVSRDWMNGAFEQIARLSRKDDLVIITMSPFGLCLLGWKIQRRLGLKVIYDLRDPWALDGWRTYSTKFHWYVDMCRMRRSLLTADGIVANTPESEKAIKANIAGIEPQKMTVITNGYDPDDFSETGENGSESYNKGSGETPLTIVHTGTLHSYLLYPSGSLVSKVFACFRNYRREKIYIKGRTPFYFLRALKILQDKNPDIFARLRIKFYGESSDFTKKMVAECGMQSKLEVIPYINHSEVFGVLKRADALWLPLHGLPEGRRSLIVPGKTYEYIGSGRKILASLPDGDAKDLVENYSICVVTDPCDENAIAGAIAKIADITDVADSAKLSAFEAVYSRKALTQKLSDFLEGVS